MHSACFNIGTLASALFVCCCSFFDLKINITHNCSINCSIKLRLCHFKTHILSGSFISLMADFFQTAHIEVNLLKPSVLWVILWITLTGRSSQGKATLESCGINSDVCVNFGRTGFKLIMSVITPGQHIAFHNYSKYAYVPVWAIMKYVSWGPIKQYKWPACDLNIVFFLLLTKLCSNLSERVLQIQYI